MPVAKKINLVSKRTLERNMRTLQRREVFLENLPVELITKKSEMKSTPSRERIKVNQTPGGYTFAEYKSSVTINVYGGPHLPTEFQMTEIVLPSKLDEDE